MPKGVRQETGERVELAQQNRPYSFGPLLGAMALKMNLSMLTISSMVGVHEQTVFRWIFGQSEIAPKYLMKVSKIAVVLSWMITSNHKPLTGTVLERQQQFVRNIAEFRNQSGL